MELTLLDVVNFFLRHKKKILIHGFISLLLGIALSLTFTKYYKATVLFAPLDAQSSTGGLLSMVASMGGVGALPGDFTQTNSYSKRLYSTIFESQTLRKEIIDEYDLITVYETYKTNNPLGLAFKKLNKNIKIDEVVEGGLGMTNVVAIELSAIDESPQRAAAIANSFYTKMEQRIIEFGRMESKRRILFLENELEECEDSLSIYRELLKTFQKENHIYDIKLQTKLVIEAIGSLKAQQISLENQLTYNRHEYGNSNSQTKATARQLAIVKAKLEKMETDSTPNFFGGLQGSLPLQYTYIDYKTKVEVFTKLKMVLLQQLEERQIKLARSFTDLYLIDKAVPPPYKFKPKRAIIALLFSIVWMSIFIIVLFLKELKSHLDTLPESEKIENFFAALKKW